MYADGEIEIKFNEAAQQRMGDPTALLDGAPGALALGGQEYRVMVTRIELRPNYLDNTQDLIISGKVTGEA